jgi:hypothetical protein
MLVAVSDSRREMEVLEFIGLNRGTPKDVFDNDLGHVRACDAMIAFVDEPSIGLGMEIMEAIHHEKPLLCLHRPEHTITRMLIGARDRRLLTIRSYTDLDGAVRDAWSFISYQEVVARSITKLHM